MYKHYTPAPVAHREALSAKVIWCHWEWFHLIPGAKLEPNILLTRKLCASINSQLRSAGIKSEVYDLEAVGIKTQEDLEEIISQISSIHRFLETMSEVFFG